jgi:para-nitrobenzyl esterase
MQLPRIITFVTTVGKYLRVALLSGIALAVSFSAWAGTAEWINHAGGAWETPANWVSGNAPIPGDDVRVSSADPCTVTSNSPVTVNSLTIDGLAAFSLTTGGLTLQAAPPGIAANPSSLTVTESQGAVFSVSATGTAPFSYQWRKDGQAIPGATGDIFAISAVTGEDAGEYDVVVSNHLDSVASGKATLTVLAAGLIKTRSGVIRGNTFTGGTEYLGIPYAAPPVGQLRWKPTREIASWDAVLDTGAFRLACPQKAYEQGKDTYEIVGDEDCLFLNVWTPSVATPSLPVMVFIHGGGNQQGSAGEVHAGTKMYDGRNLSVRGNVVVVTIQYRLGPLGFLVHPGLEVENQELTSGNYAVMDQIMALQWISSTIAAFGGDPAKVMIFGESAGGLDVGNLLVAPQAAELFQRACIQSAVPVINSYEDGKARGIAWVNSLSSAPTDQEKIADLRATDWRILVATNQKPLDGGVVKMDWQPVVDGIIFPRMPEDAFASGAFNQVPLMIGSNADETSLAAPATVTPSMVDSLIALLIPQQLRGQAHTLYPSGTTDAEARNAYVQLLTDSQFTATVRRTARAVSSRSSSPVWRYFFTHKQGGVLSSYGSYHGIELFYVFNTWENSPFATGQYFTPDDQAVEDAALKYWTNFARSGDPNGTGLAAWPNYLDTQDCYLELAPAPNGGMCGLRSDKCDFWDTVAENR